MKQYLLAFLCLRLILCGVSYAADPSTQQDIVTKSKAGDLLTRSPKRKETVGAGAFSLKTKDGRSRAATTKTSSAQVQPADNMDSVRPDENYLDVYIGRCQYTAEAITEVKNFASKHQDFFVRFYGMKTESEATLGTDVLRGLEIYLPIEAKRFDITTVPTFVLNTKGITYKISAATDIASAYEQINKKTAKGERKKGYIDLGDQGRGCPAIIPDLRPAALTPEQRQRIAYESRPPDTRGVLLANQINMQQSSQPVYLERQVSRLPLSSRFIVFSQSQRDWAIKEFKNGRSIGCCTDCLELTKLWPYAQYCTRDMLTNLGVSTVPAVITLHAAVQP
jgi:hypothetical protein